MAAGFHLTGINHPLDEAWALSAGFNEPIISKFLSKNIKQETSWEDIGQPCQLRSLNEEQNTLHYESIQHIAGGLASGKSIFSLINTYWQ